MHVLCNTNTRLTPLIRANNKHSKKLHDSTISHLGSIIKDKNKRVNDKNNYRPICLSNICSKIIELVIFNRICTFLQSSPNQFGFKPKHGTELCVFAFKELLRFYQKHGSAMHVAFLDASKAFDRVNRRKLLLKLESRGVPTYILRLLSNELIGQYICVRWGSTHSECFPIANGVKQGGILSPLLFSVYMDDLSLQLHRQPIGCSEEEEEEICLFNIVCRYTNSAM